VTAAALLAGLLASAGPRTALADASLTAVGMDTLGGRGLNAGLALADHCAYVGSRGTGPVAIVDISDPAHPTTTGQIAGRGRSTAREVRAVPGQHLLVVMTYALLSGGVNRFDFYRWSTDCAQPSPAGAYDFGTRTPHEFYLWYSASRTLLFATMFAAGNPALQVIDASDPAHPVLAGTWSTPLGELHSVSLSPDGARAYLSLWTGGFLVADVSDFTGSRASPALRLLAQPANAVPALAGGNVHSAVPVPGRDLVVLTDERYQPACPYGPARLVDVSTVAQPRQVSILHAPENSAAACAQAPPDTYTSHNPTLTAHLALITWYASGLQVFDTSDPANPVRLAEYRPRGQLPGAVDGQLGGPDTMTWSYPVVRDGLVYVADVNQGLYVIRYQGPHQEEVDRLLFAEGNSNLAREQPPPTPTPSATPSARTSPAASARPGSAHGGAPGSFPWIVLVVAVLLVAGGGGAVLLARRN
jgi:hypothetical protein